MLQRLTNIGLQASGEPDAEPEGAVPDPLELEREFRELMNFIFPPQTLEPDEEPDSTGKGKGKDKDKGKGDGKGKGKDKDKGKGDGKGGSSSST